jgi:hypothetical protein
MGGHPPSPCPLPPRIGRKGRKIKPFFGGMPPKKGTKIWFPSLWEGLGVGKFEACPPLSPKRGGEKIEWGFFAPIGAKNPQTSVFLLVEGVN